MAENRDQVTIFIIFSNFEYETLLFWSQSLKAQKIFYEKHLGQLLNILARFKVSELRRLRKYKKKSAKIWGSVHSNGFTDKKWHSIRTVLTSFIKIVLKIKKWQLDLHFLTFFWLQTLISLWIHIQSVHVCTDSIQKRHQYLFNKAKIIKMIEFYWLP